MFDLLYFSSISYFYKFTESGQDISGNSGYYILEKIFSIYNLREKNLFWLFSQV